MEFTGERYLPSLDSPEISYEHWHRYLHATLFAKGKVVLDIACGEGYGSHLLSQYASKVVGIDIDSETIRQAAIKYNNHNIEFIPGSAGSIPIIGKQVFDLIVSFETLEHIGVEEQKVFLEEIKRLLKPDGLFIVSTPNKRFYSDTTNYKNEYHVKEFYVGEFKDFLKSYFKYVVLLGQKIYPISFIWQPTKHNKQAIEEFRLAFTGEGFKPTDAAKKLLFSIGLCSNIENTYMPDTILVDLSERKFFLREKHIVKLEEILREKDTYISSFDNTFKEKDTYISSLNNTLKEKDKYILNLEIILIQKDAVINDKLKYISTLESEVNLIHSSIFYKIYRLKKYIILIIKTIRQRMIHLFKLFTKKFK